MPGGIDRRIIRTSEQELIADSLTDGVLPVFNGLGNSLIDSSISEESSRILFKKKVKVPAGSVGIGEVLELSEGLAKLVTVDLLKKQMAFAASVDFTPEEGSSSPTFIDFGFNAVLPVNTDDTQTLTDNPLTFSLTGTVAAPNIRVITNLTVRTAGAMTNFRVKATDNATGLVVRYIPSQTAFEGDVPGLNLISGDNKFVFTSNDADTSGVFNLGFIPFIIEEGQLIDFEVVADSINLKGNVSGTPYLVADINDGPLVSVLTLLSLTQGLAVNNVIHTPTLLGTTPETLSKIDVYQKTSVTGTVTAGQFSAGDITGPNVVLDSGTPVFSAGEFVLIEGDDENNGLYEVSFNLGFLLELRGVGGGTNVEDFTLDQVTTKIGTATITKVNISVHRTSLTGTTEHGAGNTAPITFHQLAHASDVPIVAIEEFANTNNRFFGELGLPASQQTWADLVTGSATIDLVTETVFGISKQVVRHNDDVSNGSTTSQISLTAQNWTDINAFGASFSGVHRLDTVDGTSGFFSGLQADAFENPIDGANRRYGIIFDNNAGNLRLIEADNTGNNVTMNGTGGNPTIAFDEYFSRQVIVPAGLGAAQVFINGKLTTFVPTFFVNGGGLGTRVLISSGSTGGTNRITYHDNFGVTIYEESATKTLTVATMDSDIAQIFVPEGKRDYTVILPDGNPRKLGNRLDFIVQNLGGKLKIRTENLSSPQSLFNGLREIEKEITSITPISLINTIEASNVYLEDTDILNQNLLGFEPGSINYDPIKGTMNIRNIFPGSSVQVGQESVVFVINNTGATITDGKVVNISGYDATNDAMEITMALADTVENTEVLGMSTTKMLDGEVGLITVFGRVNDLDTTSFTGGEIVYLSDTIAGGLTTTRPAVPIQMGHIGKIDALVGFIQIEIRELERSIFGGYSHSLNQTFTADVSKPISFDTNEEVSGIAHSETVDNSEFTFTSGGVYQATAEPQYTRTTGGGTDVLNMFLSKDTGSGFVNVADSNVKFSINTSGNTTVSPLTATFRVNAGDKIRFMAQVESANLILNAFAASGSAPNEIPLTPSIIMNIVRIGD